MLNYQDNLRHQVKTLKSNKHIKYKTIAALLNISLNSFYNWINNQYNLSLKKRQELESIIKELQQ